MGKHQKSDWRALALLSAVVAAGGIYDLATSTAPPSQVTRLLLYILLASTLIGLVGWAARFKSQR